MLSRRLFGFACGRQVALWRLPALSRPYCLMCSRFLSSINLRHASHCSWLRRPCHLLLSSVSLLLCCRDSDVLTCWEFLNWLRSVLPASGSSLSSEQATG